MPSDWAEGLRQAIAAEAATRHEETTAERELLATQRERLESERYKLMEAYCATAIDVTMLRREQERIGAEVRAIESRQAVLDASLDDWQDVMDLTLRFSTRCATAYHRSGDRTRRLLNTALIDQVHVRDGHIIEAAYKEPFELLFSSPKFEYGDLVEVTSRARAASLFRSCECAAHGLCMGNCSRAAPAQSGRTSPVLAIIRTPPPSNAALRHSALHINDRVLVEP